MVDEGNGLRDGEHLLERGQGKPVDQQRFAIRAPSKARARGGDRGWIDIGIAAGEFLEFDKMPGGPPFLEHAPCIAVAAGRLIDAPRHDQPQFHGSAASYAAQATGDSRKRTFMLA